MSLQIQLKKSAVSQKQPFASDLAVGELALNYNADGPFLTCKDTEGNVRKLNNVWVAAAAPTNPTAGDLWLDTNLTTAVLKVYKDSTSGWVNATTIPVATTSIFGTVRLATSSDITNGTSGKVVDAAQLQSKITDLLSNDVVLNGDLEVNGDLTVNGTTTTIDTETLIVEDKNIEMGVVATPTDNTADGGGITLKGATDKTLNWVNATDSWTSSENLDLASGKSYRINGTEVLSATALGSAVQISSANIPNGTIVDSDINVAAEIAVSKLADGDARQLLQTDAAGTGVEWTSNVDVPGTLDVTGAATFDSSVSVTGALTKSGNNVVTVGDTGTVTSTMIANNTIVNEDINASAAIADTKLDTISTAGKVSNSATTATSANTASAIVARDASGNFTAGTVTASLAGNADTATKLNSTRTFAVTGDVTGTVSSDLTSGATIATSIASGVIVDADINASAEIAVSKLADGDARQLLQTDAAGTGVEWTSNVDVPGTLDVTGAATFDSSVAVTGTLTKSGNNVVTVGDTGTVTSTMILDGTIVNGDINASAAIAGTKISPDFGAQNVTTTGTSTAASFIPTSSTVPTNGVYLPAANSVALSTNGAEALRINADGDIQVADGNRMEIDEIRARDAAGLKLFDDAGAGIFIQDGGSVGIGTSSPQELLHISKSNSGGNFVGQIIQNTANPASLGTSTELRLRLGNDAPTHKYAGIRAIGTANYNNKIDLAFFTANGDNSFPFSNEERVRITGDGKVGIGTTSPGALLQVSAGTTETAGNITRLDTYYTGIADAVRISNQRDFGASNGRGMRLSFTTGDSTAGYLQNEGLSGSRVFSFINQDQAFLVSDRTNSVLRLSAPGTTSGVVDLNYRSGGTSFLGARIDSSGRLLVGTSSARSNFYNSSGTLSGPLQIEGTNNLTRVISQILNSSGSEGPLNVLAKSRGSSVGSNTIVQQDDQLGAISFQGSDGTEFVESVRIQAFVDGTPGADDMPGRLVFSTTADGASSPTERVRIDSSGNLLIGGTYTTWLSNYVGAIYGKGGSPRLVLGRSDASDGTARSCAIFTNSSDNGVGSISVTSTATAFNTSSDYRLKENVTPVTDGITRLQQLKPSRFNFIADPSTVVDGFIAHEVQAVVPEAITGTKDEVDADGTPIYQGIDQSKLVPLLTAALQEAVAKIESLEARLTAAGI